MPVALTKENFSELTEPLRETLIYAALNVVPDYHVAEDLVQDALIKAYENIDTFKQVHLKAWLCSIIRNCATSHWRKLQVQRKNQPKVAVDIEIAPNKLDSDALLAATEAVDTLPPSWKELFELATYEELQYKEISERLNIPEGTVMSRLFRAREIVRTNAAQILREQHADSGKR